MSFLNPVNESVLRFSSTDADAPQINYAARTAGDVKTVLKACLVDGYGTKASAGWTAVNETTNVIEFVNPIAAMSDYRLCVDDSSASSTTWYYQYQDARVNPIKNSTIKNLLHINKTHEKNGWHLLVASRGFYFIELAQGNHSNNTVARVTWFGQVKSALITELGVNMAFWSTGHNAADPDYFFNDGSKGQNLRYIHLSQYNTFDFMSSNLSLMQQKPKAASATVKIASEVYLRNGNNLIGQQPGLYFLNTSAEDDIETYVTTTPLDALRVNIAWEATPGTNSEYYREASRVLLIDLNDWGF